MLFACIYHLTALRPCIVNTKWEIITKTISFGKTVEENHTLWYEQSLQLIWGEFLFSNVFLHILSILSLAAAVSQFFIG